MKIVITKEKNKLKKISELNDGEIFMVGKYNDVFMKSSLVNIRKEENEHIKINLWTGVITSVFLDDEVILLDGKLEVWKK